MMTDEQLLSKALKTERLHENLAKDLEDRENTGKNRNNTIDFETIELIELMFSTF